MLKEIEIFQLTLFQMGETEEDEIVCGQEMGGRYSDSAESVPAMHSEKS